jgi:hypothetical protein
MYLFLRLNRNAALLKGANSAVPKIVCSARDNWLPGTVLRYSNKETQAYLRDLLNLLDKRSAEVGADIEDGENTSLGEVYVWSVPRPIRQHVVVNDVHAEAPRGPWTPRSLF